MSSSRNPIPVTREELLPFWTDPSMTCKEIALRLGYLSTRAFMAKAKALGMEPRRNLFVNGHLRDSAPVSSFTVTPTAHRYACSICGTRSLTPVHASCEARSGRPVARGR